jgi:hypothetical protein
MHVVERGLGALPHVRHGRVRILGDVPENVRRNDMTEVLLYVPHDIESFL